MAYTDSKLGEGRGKRLKFKDDPTPHLETLKSKDKEAIKADIKSTKAGAIMGAAGMLNPVTFGITAPAYVIFRAQGMSREEAAERAFRVTVKIVGACLIFIPIPPPFGAPFRAAGVAMLALTKPIEKMSNSDINTLKRGATLVAKDPEMQQHMVSAATQMAVAAGSEGGISEADLTKIGIETVNKTASVAAKQAVKEGELTPSQVNQISQIASSTTSSNASLTKSGKEVAQIMGDQDVISKQNAQLASAAMGIASNYQSSVERKNASDAEKKRLASLPPPPA